MHHHLRQVPIRRAFSTLYKSTSEQQRRRLIDRVDLAKIGVVTLSVVSGISIYATSVLDWDEEWPDVTDRELMQHRS
jgi:hypothetical protein